MFNIIAFCILSAGIHAHSNKNDIKLNLTFRGTVAPTIIGNVETNKIVNNIYEVKITYEQYHFDKPTKETVRYVLIDEQNELNKKNIQIVLNDGVFFSEGWYGINEGNISIYVPSSVIALNTDFSNKKIAFIFNKGIKKGLKNMGNI